MSGFGGRAQWFRNVQASPPLRVYIGSRGPAPAVARLLTREEARAALGRPAHSVMASCGSGPSAGPVPAARLALSAARPPAAPLPGPVTPQ